MLVDVEVETTALPPTARKCATEGRGSPWAPLLCRSLRAVRHATGPEPVGCGSRGCLPCARRRLGRWAARLRDTGPVQGGTARMVVLTAPAVRRAEDVTAFLGAVRRFVAWLAEGDCPTGAWVAECVVRDERSEVVCPLCGSPPAWAVRRVASVVAGRRLTDGDAVRWPVGEGPFAVASAYLRSLAPGGEGCPACAGLVYLPQVHLHAHLVVHQPAFADWGAWWARWRSEVGHETAWLGVDRRPATDPAGYLAKAVSEYIVKAAKVDDEHGVDGVQWEVNLAAAQRGALVGACWYGATRTRGTWGAWAGEPARPVGTPSPVIQAARGLTGEAPPACAPIARWDDRVVEAYAPEGGRWLRPAAGSAVVEPVPAGPSPISFSVLGKLNVSDVGPGADAEGRGPGTGGVFPGVGAESNDACGGPEEPDASAGTASGWSPTTFQPGAPATVDVVQATHGARGTPSRLRVRAGEAAVVVGTPDGDALVAAAGSALSVPARRGVPAPTLAALALAALAAWADVRSSVTFSWAHGGTAPVPPHWTRLLDDALTGAGYPPVAVEVESKRKGLARSSVPR